MHKLLVMQEGDVDTILHLKELAKSREILDKKELNKLYYDGNKNPAVSKIILREGISSIGDFKFVDCKKLENVIFPDSVESIKERTFEGCTNLERVE